MPHQDKDMLNCNATTATGAAATSQTKHSQEYLNNSRYRKQTNTAKNSKPESFSSSSPQLYIHKPHHHHHNHHHLTAANPSALEDQIPPPIPPLPLNYQRSDGLLIIFINPFRTSCPDWLLFHPIGHIFPKFRTNKDIIFQMRATLTRHASIRSNVPYRRLHDKLSSSDCESLKKSSGNRRRSRCS